MKELKNIEEVVFAPADKGKAVAIDDESNYIEKEKTQISIMGCTLATKPAHILIKNIRQKIIKCFNEMNIPWKEYKEFLVTGEKMACSRLLIKIHKDNFPGRPIINQIDDPTYLLCKELTRILMPLKQKAQSYI